MKNKNIKFIHIKTNLTTNFKPNKIKEFNSLNFFKKNNQIFCKNFLIFIILIKYKFNNFFNNSSIFIKKYKKKTYTILRSPYRHKLARHQIHTNRYVLYNSIKIKIKTTNFKKWTNLINYLIFLKKSNSLFESNIIYINNIKLIIPFKFNKIFYLNAFK